MEQHRQRYVPCAVVPAKRNVLLTFLLCMLFQNFEFGIPHAVSVTKDTKYKELFPVLPGQ